MVMGLYGALWGCMGCGGALWGAVGLTMQAVLQMSAGGPYSAPSSTSSARYCRVWMSSVKWWCWERGEGGPFHPPGTDPQHRHPHHPAAVAQIRDLHAQAGGAAGVQRVLQAGGDPHTWGGGSGGAAGGGSAPPNPNNPPRLPSSPPPPPHIICSPQTSNRPPDPKYTPSPPPQPQMAPHPPPLPPIPPLPPTPAAPPAGSGAARCCCGRTCSWG